MDATELDLSKPRDIDFGAGIFAFVVCKVRQQSHEGRKHIFDIGNRGRGHQRLTLALDETDQLLLRVVSVNGTSIGTKPLPRDFFYEKWRAFTFGLQPMGESMSMNLLAGNELLVSSAVRFKWQVEEQARATLGESLSGDSSAAVSVVEAGLIQGWPTDEERLRLQQFFEHKYGDVA